MRPSSRPHPAEGGVRPGTQRTRRRAWSPGSRIWRSRASVRD